MALSYEGYAPCEGVRITSHRSDRGLLLGEAVYSPGLQVPRHSHPLPTLCMAISPGYCEEQYGPTRRQYNKFSLSFLPAGHVHSLSFGAVPLRAFFADIPTRMVDSFRPHPMGLDESLHWNGGPAAWLFSRVYEEFHQSDTASSLAIEGLLFEILASISRSSERGLRPPPRWLQRARDYLHANFLEDLSLSVIAQAAGVHPVHLAREFRRHYRSTVGAYLRRLRIEYSCNALLDVELPITQIAAASGFADHSHFCRTFKRLVGVTPSVFRWSRR